MPYPDCPHKEKFPNCLCRTCMGGDFKNVVHCTHIHNLECNWKILCDNDSKQPAATLKCIEYCSGLRNGQQSFFKLCKRIK